MGATHHFPSYGRGGKRRRHKTRNVWHKSARLRRNRIQSAEPRGAGPRLFVARPQSPAGTRQNWHLQPLLLRGSAGGARPSRFAATAAPAEKTDTRWHVGKAL